MNRSRASAQAVQGMDSEEARLFSDAWRWRELLQVAYFQSCGFIVSVIIRSLKHANNPDGVVACFASTSEGSCAAGQG